MPDADFSEVKALAADLSKAGPLTVAKGVKVLRKTAFDIQRAAKGLAPVDTGALRNSIGVDFPTPLTAVIGPTMEYGPYVEFGTSRQSPQPYMGPAADRHEPRFYAAMEQVLGETLD